MSLLTGILTAYAILLMGVLSPGPAVALLLGIAGAEGRTPAVLCCAGIALGSMSVNVLTLLGVGLLLTQTAWAFALLKAFGVAYLLWLSFSAIRRALHPPVIGKMHQAPRSIGARVLQGYLMQVTNPKAIGFWLAIAALSPVAGAPVWVVALYVLGGGALSFFGHAAWGVALSSRPFQRVYAAARRWIEGVLGALFAVFALKLATSES